MPPAPGPSLLPELQGAHGEEGGPSHGRAGPPEQVWLPGQSLTDLPKRRGGTAGSGGGSRGLQRRTGSGWGARPDLQVSTGRGIIPAQGPASSVTHAESKGRALSRRGRPQAIFWSETTQLLNGCGWWLLLGQSFSNPKGLFPSSEHGCESNTPSCCPWVPPQTHLLRSTGAGHSSREIPPSPPDFASSIGLAQSGRAVPQWHPTKAGLQHWV